MPIANTSNGFKVATDERVDYIEEEDEDPKAFTEYDGFYVENDTDMNDEEAFNKVCEILNIK